MSHGTGNDKVLSPELFQSIQRILRSVPFTHSNSSKRPAITFTQMRILSFFEERDVLHISELSRTLGMSITSVNNLITRLEASGYVSKAKNKENRRFSDIRLTPKGKKSLASSAEAHFQYFKLLLSTLDVAEAQELHNSLLRASQLIEIAFSRSTNANNKER